MKPSSAQTQIVNHSEVHHPFVPQEVRKNDPINASLTIDNNHHKFPIWKISPFGVELIVDETFKYEISDKYNVIINVGQETSSLNGVLVCDYHERGNHIVCVRFTTEHSAYNNTNRRLKKRWNCSSQFYPTGIANSPARYNDFIYFKIKDISYGGMKITCSLRNKFLFPKMTLNAMINFPMFSQVNLKLKIINLNIAHEDGKDVISIGASYDTNDTDTTEVICNYLLQFSNASSLDQLRQDGFSSGKVSTAIDFTYVKSKEDYQESLELRLLANKTAQKVDSNAKLDDMSDEYDVRSRIIVGKHNGNAVCTARLAFHELDDKMEIEKYTILPESFPRRDDTIEIMRLCTHPSYRGSDLLMALFKHIAIVAVQSRRKYAIASCVEKLVPLYEKIGYKQTGIKYENPLFKGFPDYVMIADIEKLLLGIGINPIIWNIVWGDLYKYFEDYNIVDHTPLEKLRVKAIRTLKPIAQIVEKRIVKKKK